MAAPVTIAYYVIQMMTVVLVNTHSIDSWNVSDHYASLASSIVHNIPHSKRITPTYHHL